MAMIMNLVRGCRLFNQPQTRRAGVAKPTETASRLVAGIQLDNGFPLDLGVAVSDITS